MKKITRVLYVIMGILIIICGVYCLFTPISTTGTLGFVVGFSMILDAVGLFVGWSQARKDGSADGWMLTSAILSALFGFFIVNSAALQLGIDLFLMYYIAAWLVSLGIITIVRSFKVRRMHKSFNTQKIGANWYLFLIFGILLTLLGILCMFNPLIPASVIGVFIALGIITVGAEMITLATTPDL